MFQELNALPAGRFLIGDGTEKSALDAFSLVANWGPQAQMERFAVEGQRFREAIRVTVPVEPTDTDATYWHIFPRADSKYVVQKGDAMWLTFWARVVPGTARNDEGRFQVTVKHESGTGAQGFAEGGLMDGDGRVGAEWKQFVLPLAANQSDKPRIEIYCNYKKQVLEFGGFAFISFGQALTRDQLPAPRLNLNYPGREANASWRKAAQTRIEKHRKGALRVLVRDKTGKPVPNAQVRVTMTRHAFPFGSHVPSHNFPATDRGGYTGENFRSRSSDPGPVGQQYRALVKQNFNMVTTGFGWRLWDSSGLRPDVINAINQWRGMGIDVKNHVILYPREDLVPDDVVKLDAVQARARLFQYVREMVPAMKGKIAVYDVMNEPFGSLLYQQKFGADREGYLQMLADLYKEVKRLDPQAKLFLNDAGQESPEPREKFLAFARELLKRGAPIDGFGVQFHIGSLNPMEVLKAFDELSRGGQLVSVSEFDTVVSTKRTPEIEAYQADLLRDLLTASFSHPKVDHFIMWGFWDGDHWLGNGPLYNLDWSPKPAQKVWRQLVFKDWWTRDVGRTNSKGEYSTRGFIGDYAVSISVNGKTQTVQTKLRPGGKPLAIKLAS
jgi:hypothetical protein